MAQTMPFRDVVEAVDQLSVEEQEALILLVRRRLAELGRKRLVADVQEAREEFKAGGCKPTTVDDLMREIQS